DRAVAFTAPAAGRYGFAVHPDAPFDAIVSVRDGCGGLERACADDAVAVDLAAGESVVVGVDGERGAAGTYTLDLYAASDVELGCADGRDDDVDGATDCVDPDCDPDPACVEGCADGLDDDGDGFVDCADRGCVGDPACAELCGNGLDDDLDGDGDCADPDCDLEPACAEDCANALDDDGDGFVDCADGGCACPTVCPEDAVGALPAAIAGTTVGAADDYTPSCALSSASDRTAGFTAPADGRYRFDTAGTVFDTVLTVLDGCGGAERACSDDAVGRQSSLAVDLVAGEAVVVVVDGFDRNDGAYVLNVTAIPSTELGCGDGADDDADGLVDCADPDCLCVETCDDAVDDDADGAIDCLDPDCVGDPACASICPEAVASGALPIVVEGATVGATADQASSCGGASASDDTVAFTAPADGVYTFDTAGSAFDTVVSVVDGCGGVELGCADDTAGSAQGAVAVALVAGQAVVVVVDGFGTASGDWVLTVQ
ncbi:MAG: hypothetical protein ABMB14_20140, partial [Myxococcota bacterium]